MLSSYQKKQARKSNLGLPVLDCTPLGQIRKQLFLAGLACEKRNFAKELKGIFCPKIAKNRLWAS